MAITRNILLAVGGSCLLAAFVLVQNAGAGPPGHIGGPGGGMRGMPSFHGTSGGGVPSRGRSLFIGGPRGPASWSDFHHDTAPARVTPHRFGNTNLPRPNSWRGNARDFDLGAWQSGAWRHEDHGGRLGWWWVIGADWFFFDAPVYPYPDLYTPLGEPLGWWYWCDAYNEYYPYVTDCPVAWEPVMPVE